MAVWALTFRNWPLVVQREEQMDIVQMDYQVRV